jgi:transposase-like protein
MGKQRKVEAEQKLTIALSVLQEQQKLAELCRQYGVAESLVHQ